MIDSRDTAGAFDRIAAEIEPLLTRLGRAAPGAELETIRDEITALLDGAGLRWSDVAARVAAPSPSKAAASPAHAPPPPMPPMLTPKHEPTNDPAKVWTNEELLKLGGYRTPPGQTGYGYEGTPIQGADTLESTAG